jgi:2-methylfumaryl-CoA isomerase
MSCRRGTASRDSRLRSAFERHRSRTGKGQLVELALKDMALAMLGNLGIIGEVTVNNYDRPKMGNSLYGAYAQDFVCKDGSRVIAVGLTNRQWDNIQRATDTRGAFDALALRLNVDLDEEGERFRHRGEITKVLQPFFASRVVKDFAGEFDRTGVTWSRYRTFKEVIDEDPDCSVDNPMVSLLDHPGIGSYLTPGNPIAFSGVERIRPVRAPSLGENTDEILAELGYSDREVGSFHDAKIVA